MALNGILKMATWLISFADASFKKSQDRLCASAARFGIDHIQALGMRDLKPDPYYSAHRDLFNRRRGVGFWLWKPLFIKRTLAKMPDGDTLLYCDAGVEIVSSLKPLIDLVEKNGGILPFALHDLYVRDWTKRDCLILLGCDTPDYYNLEQANGAFLLFRKCPAAVEFVDQWLAACTDARTLTDDPNVMGKENLPSFIAHRHDQSVLSLCLRKKKIEFFRDPSQHGNGWLKPPPGTDLSTWPWSNSTYPVIFAHHRQRSVVLRTAPGVAWRVMGRFFRALLPAQHPKPTGTGEKGTS